MPAVGRGCARSFGRVRPVLRDWWCTLALVLGCATANIDTVPDAEIDSAHRWGAVGHREVHLGRASFTLLAARHCKEIPRPTAPRDVVLDVDAQRARCRLAPWHGPVGLEVERDGQWSALTPAHSDRHGRLELRFAELDREVRDAGAGGLGEFTRLRVGRGGWAGTYDLVRLRALQADVHAAWVKRGRGVPGLFVALHPEHARAEDIADLALESRLARQERDFEAIEHGELTPEAFLDRHVWSPLRVRVAALLGARRSDG